MTRTLPETPDLRWFDPYPSCRMCGKASAGQLMSVRNERYGDHCKRCADKRLKLSAKVREQLAAESAQ
jgi:hypothetical protein